MNEWIKCSDSELQECLEMLDETDSHCLAPEEFPKCEYCYEEVVCGKRLASLDYRTEKINYFCNNECRKGYWNRETTCGRCNVLP